MSNDKYRAYFIIREDLNMSPAKLAVQVGHGCCLMFRDSLIEDQMLEDWVTKNDMKKIVVKVSSEEQRKKVYINLLHDNIHVNEIYDLGLTELKGFTYTGLVVLVEEDETPKYIKKLRLYK